MDEFAIEVREHVTAISGHLRIGDDSFSVVRPFTTSPTAIVEVAGREEAQRLPAQRLDATSVETYGQWLLGKLGLPRLEVPSAPTLPQSEPTPVSINDYMMYCDLAQDEIDSSVFGHRQPFKNIKRKYVFEILWGIYGVETAVLQEDLRTVVTAIRQIESQTEAFERFLRNSPLENRTQLHVELDNLRIRLADLQSQAVGEAKSSAEESSAAQALRTSLLEIDELRAARLEELDRVAQALRQLRQLDAQLRTQSARLTKAIVAETYLLDFEFTVCPRCGTAVEEFRGDEQTCRLCLQTPSPGLTREDLVEEQARISAQITETTELIERHSKRAEELEREVQLTTTDREAIGRALDLELRSYVSDNAERISTRAADIARVEARIDQVQEYLALLDRLDRALGDLAGLQERRRKLEDQLDILAGRKSAAEDQIRRLEAVFEEVLRAFGVPRFADPPESRIDRETYLPIVDGRRFDQVSSQGLKVLINVAYALAVHKTAIELGLGLPGLLLIDGPSSNVGHEGFDYERITDVYRYLIDTSESFGESLQLIVADNDVPPQAEPFVRMSVSEENRLIPT